MSPKPHRAIQRVQVLLKGKLMNLIAKHSNLIFRLDLSESEDEPTDLVTAFEGPTDLFGNMSSSDEE